MCGCQYNAVTATVAQSIITAVACQPDNFIFSGIRQLDTRKQAVWFLVLRKPDHHAYRVNNANINGVFQYPVMAFWLIVFAG